MRLNSLCSALSMGAAGGRAGAGPSRHVSIDVDATSVTSERSIIAREVRLLADPPESPVASRRPANGPAPCLSDKCYIWRCCVA